MTNQTQKQAPDFYVFTTAENGLSTIEGRVYAHKTKKKLTLYIGGKKYNAYPPKTITEAVEEESA